MENLLQIQKVIYPDLLRVMKKRYDILYLISTYGPIGRRLLIEKTSFTERFIRNEIEFLQKHQLIEMTSKGMYATETGKEIVEALFEFNHELSNLTQLETQLGKKFNIDNVIVVPGNCDVQPSAKTELGRATVKFLKGVINEDLTIAVTGGSTMAAVAKLMEPFEENKCFFVPARGGIGENVDNQANTIIAKMAVATNGNYEMFHIPDSLNESLYYSLLNEKTIAETLSLIKGAQIVIHGIGDALTLAKRRKTSQETMKKLIEREAVGEAFGYYFDIQGQIVHKVWTLGMQLEDLENINDVITVAGGQSKASAIISFMQQKKSDVLITDEGAAKKIIFG